MMAAMEDTSFSSSDTFSPDSTPPSSPDVSHDTPTRKPDLRFGTPVLPFPSLYLPHCLKTEDGYSNLHTSSTDSVSRLSGLSSPSTGDCSRQPGQKLEFKDTAARYSIHASHNIIRRSVSLGRVDFDPGRLGTTQHGKPRSQSLSELVSEQQERYIGSKLGETSLSATDTPDTEPSLSLPSPNEADDTRALPSAGSYLVDVKKTESLPFEFDTSAVSFETQSRKNEAEVRLLGARGNNGPRKHTLGVNSRRLMSSPRGRPRSRVHNSISPVSSEIPEVHSDEYTRPNLEGATQSEIDVFQSRSSHSIRLSFATIPEINFLYADEPHNASAQLRNAPEEHMRKYSFTEKSLGSILPRKIGQLLIDDISRCTAFNRTRPTERCSRKHRGDPLTVSAQLHRFVSIDVGDASSCINGLLNSILCSQHTKLAGKDWECWRSILPDLNPTPNNIEDPRLPVLVSWIQELQAGIKTLGLLAGSNTKAEDGQVSVPVKPKATTQELVRYHSLVHESKELERILHRTCVSSLTNKQDHDAGFIYIYWSPEGFGRMKIGYSNDIIRRLKAWETQCKRKLYLHFPKESEKGLPLQHVWRVEKLIHTELGYYRRKEPKCMGCNKAHIEWFEGLSVDLAVEVTKKWIDWMRRGPYVERDCNGKVEWMLSDVALESLEGMCKPHHMLRSGVSSTKR